MKTSRAFLVAILCLSFAHAALAKSQAPAAGQPATQPSAVVNAALDRLSGLFQVPQGETAPVFSATLRITRAEGLPKEADGAAIDVAIQAPANLFLNASVRGNQYTATRAGDSISIYVPERKFGVVGVPGVARFKSDPASIDNTKLGPLTLPINPSSLKLPLMLMQYELLADETIDNESCYVVKVAAPERAAALLKLPPGSVELAVRKSDAIPARIRFTDGKANVELAVQNIAFTQNRPAEQWKPAFKADDKVETVAVSHLVRCIDVMQDNLTTRVPTLGPATGRKKLVGTSGQGRLENHDGTRVLFLKGTPEEMGRQQGELLRNECRDLVERILYGVGVGSSFPKGKWFIGEIEDAHARLAPFISQRIYREIDATADAAGVSHTEARLANFFPELFHCSGFALTGDATVGGRMYHGRILDYLKGVGLEQNAVVMVYQPDEGNAWVNIGYAGFAGTVTAMNEKHISIGEMGGRGEGNWDGKPMAQLLREVMEKANTLDEAVEIMRKGPRTCEYYYVVSDGNSKRAVGIAATPTTFEVIHLGEAHPRLPHAVKDAVLLSAGDRYETLVARVKANYGKIDAAGARELMTRPVAMPSCIHAVLFAPDTLDFWVANADSKSPASHTRYTKYNLRGLLESKLAQ
jgi:hypothetical protein